MQRIGAACDDLLSGKVDTVVILENDLYRRNEASLDRRDVGGGQERDRDRPHHARYGRSRRCRFCRPPRSPKVTERWSTTKAVRSVSTRCSFPTGRRAGKLAVAARHSQLPPVMKTPANGTALDDITAAMADADPSLCRRCRVFGSRPGSASRARRSPGSRIATAGERPCMRTSTSANR